jgi:hypothetical protein
MTSKRTIVCLAALILALTLASFQSLPGAAQAPDQPQSPAAPLQTLAGNTFTYQGYLTSGGAPANGLYDLSFSLYADAAGTQWVTDAAMVDNLSVVNGLFTAKVDLTDPMYGDIHFDLNGEARWLKIGVRPGASIGAFTYLSPLQPLTPVPYAQALPGLHTVQNSTSANVVGGYSWNSVNVNAVGATISGGGRSGSTNTVNGNYGTIGGGRGNIAGGLEATVGGGTSNSASQASSAVGGGSGNTASGVCAVVTGGCGNQASSTSASVVGGEVNFATGSDSTVGGGSGNTAQGSYATVPGGDSNYAGGNYSLAAGRRAHANNVGSFVWADSTDEDFTSTMANQFRVRAGGGAEIIANNAAYGLQAENTNTMGDGLRAIGQVSNGSSYAALYAYNSGTSPAVYANSWGTYSGYFQDDIYVAGSCVGCTSAYVALNDGDLALEAGDLVAVGGLAPSLTATSAPVLQVHRAEAGSAVVGVVQGRAEIVKSEKEGQTEESAERCPGAAAPGDYLFVVVQGMAQVKADASQGTIEAGQRLTAAATAGMARALQSRQVEGMTVAEDAPVVGIALGPLDAGTGLIPVLVTLH